LLRRETNLLGKRRKTQFNCLPESSLLPRLHRTNAERKADASTMGDKAASQDEKSDEEETMGDNASEDEKSDEEKSVQLEDMLEQDDDDDDNQESNPRPKKTKPWYNTTPAHPNTHNAYMIGSRT